MSLSDKGPAIQGGVDIGHDSGCFVVGWASSIADTGGSNVEVDIYGGYGGTVGGVDYSVTALAYIYPGGSGVDYFETKGSLGTAVGAVRSEERRVGKEGVSTGRSRWSPCQ